MILYIIKAVLFNPVKTILVYERSFIQADVRMVFNVG